MEFVEQLQPHFPEYSVRFFPEGPKRGILRVRRGYRDGIMGEVRIDLNLDMDTESLEFSLQLVDIVRYSLEKRASEWQVIEDIVAEPGRFDALSGHFIFHGNGQILAHGETVRKAISGKEKELEKRDHFGFQMPTTLAELNEDLAHLKLGFRRADA